MLRVLVLAILALVLSAPATVSAAAHDGLSSLLGAPGESDALLPSGWTFFEPCDGGLSSRAADAPEACGRLALSDPTTAEDTRTAPSGSATEPAAPIDPVGSGVSRERPNHLLGSALLGASLGVAAGFSFSNGPHEDFHFANEGWFGQTSYAGGADKAAHFVLSAFLARELTHLYARLGYSRTQSHLLGFGVSALSGLVLEVGDGTTEFGFSYEDLLMDVFGAGAAVLISAAGIDDLVGFRWGFLLPREKDTCCAVRGLGGDYSNAIYTADLKLAGVGRRLGIGIGPLRYLLLSVTYGVKGYPSGVPEDRQRRVGVDVGLNVAEILSDLGARRNTWWGYLLQAFTENVRVPYTAGGFRYDLNHGRWYGPTTR